MFAGLESIKFGFDRTPKKQNNATPNLEISFPHIYHKNKPNMTTKCLNLFWLIFGLFSACFRVPNRPKTILCGPGRSASIERNKPKAGCGVAEWGERDDWAVFGISWLLENHKKIIGKYRKILQLLGHVYGKFMEKSCLIILLQFVLKTFRFGYMRDKKPRCS